MEEKANLASFLGIRLDNSTVHTAISKIHLLSQESCVCTSCQYFYWIPEEKKNDAVGQRNNPHSNATIQLNATQTNNAQSKAAVKCNVAQETTIRVTQRDRKKQRPEQRI